MSELDADTIRHLIERVNIFGVDDMLNDLRREGERIGVYKGTCCELDNNEARAIQKLLIDLQSTDDEVVQEWIGAIWWHYVMGESIRDIAKSNDTYIAQIQQDIKCGLAFIKSRYPHFQIEKFTKSVDKDIPPA